MEQTAAGLLVIGWKLALALFAGIPILTTIGVYGVARFTSVLDAYAGERAKLLAQCHNLEKLVEQTKVLTATTEAIKADIQHGVWETQTILTLKRDIYTRLLEAIGQMIEDHQDSVFHERMHRSKFRDVPALHELHETSAKRLEETMKKFNRAGDVAPILISDEAYTQLQSVFVGLLQIDYSGPRYELDANRNIEHLKACRHRLQQAARADLGMTKLPFDKPL
jgi:hypothetical protein